MRLLSLLRLLPRRAPFLRLFPFVTGVWSVPLGAQTSRLDPVDVHGRYGVTVNLDLPRKWEAALEYELRMVGNARTYRGSYITAEAGYPLSKRLSLLGNYRLATVTEGLFHRVAGGAQLEQKIADMSLSFRSLVQYQRQQFQEDEERSDEDLLHEEVFVRTRVRAKLSAWRRTSLYASVEPYWAFHRDFPIDNWRNTVGLQLPVGKTRKLDLHYIYRPDYARIYNRTFHIIGVEVIMDVKLPR
jgi:hypothetical protein